MAYGDFTYNADHRWSFNNVLTDSLGSLTLGTSGGTAFVASPMTRDATHIGETNNRDGRYLHAGSTDINNAALEHFAIAGWFRVSQTQGPPCCIYAQGNKVNNQSIILWAGNAVQFQCVADTGNVLNTQIYSDINLTNNRAYHLAFKFSGTAGSNEFSAYIDGVKQTDSDPLDPSVDILEFPYVEVTGCKWGEAGSAGTDISVTTLTASVNGEYAEWWTWSESNANNLSDADIAEVFASGAIPDTTITSGSQSAMQSQLDAIASSSFNDRPLNILVEGVSGGGDLSLSADNVTFDTRASLNVRYEGSGTLFWTNDNGSNATKSSGNVNFLNPSLLTLTGLENPTEVRVYQQGVINEIAGEENVTTGTFAATVSFAAVDITLISLDYQIIRLKNIDTSTNTTINVQQFFDRQYENP